MVDPIVWTPEELKAMKIVNKPYREEKITSCNPLDITNKNRFSFSSYIVDLTCSDYKQDAQITISGRKGAGKSFGSLSIAYACAVKTAEKLDNDPSNWSSYFSIDNVAIMDTDKMIEILQRSDTHQCLIFDDVGTMQGARKYKSEANQIINDTLVSCRTLNSIFLSSAPELFHQDKVARQLGEFQLEFVRNEALMQKGYSIAKPLIRVTDPKNLNGTYYKFPHFLGAKVERIIIPKPPKALTDEYDKLREIGRKHLQNKLGQAMSDADQQTPGAIRQAKQQEQINKAQSLMDSMRFNPDSNTKKFKRIAEQLGLSPVTIRSWYSNGKIC